MKKQKENTSNQKTKTEKLDRLIEAGALSVSSRLEAENSLTRLHNPN
jgi:hypothetical protein